MDGLTKENQKAMLLQVRLSEFNQGVDRFRSFQKLPNSDRRLLERNPRTNAFFIEKLHQLSKQLGVPIPSDIAGTIKELKARTRLGRKLAESRFRAEGISRRRIKAQRGSTIVKK